MKAARLHAYQEPLALDEVDEPRAVGPLDVVVRIGAAGLCRTDLHIQEGQWAEKSGVTLPYTLGHENAGWIHEVGSGVTNVEVGDTVIVHPFISCGLCGPCRAGNDMHCLNGSFPGINRDGGFADFLMTSARSVVKLGPGLDPKDIAALADAGLTAIHAVSDPEAFWGGKLNLPEGTELPPTWLGRKRVPARHHKAAHLTAHLRGTTLREQILHLERALLECGQGAAQTGSRRLNVDGAAQAEARIAAVQQHHHLDTGQCAQRHAGAVIALQANLVERAGAAVDDVGRGVDGAEKEAVIALAAGRRVVAALLEVERVVTTRAA